VRGRHAVGGRAPRSKSPRRILFTITTIVLVGLFSIVALELIARLVLPVEKISPNEDFYRHAWIANRMTPIGQLHPDHASDHYDAELGWSPVTGHRSQDINVTALGLRGIREIPTEKANGETRIVSTGDSFTWGQGVAETWDLTRAILDATVDEARAHDAAFMLLYIPAARPNLSRVPEISEAVLSNWARGRGQLFLNLRPLFLDLPDVERRGLYAGHLTPHGHLVTAGLIAKFLEDEDLLEPSPLP
jgi:hypothetical protein